MTVTGQSSRIYFIFYVIISISTYSIHMGLQDTIIIMGIVWRPLKEQNRCQVMQMLYKKESVSVGHDVTV